MQMYGCRVIQKALDVLPIDEQLKIVTELQSHILDCIKDQNGNHVIQKAIEQIPSKHIDFIILAFKSRILSLATHPYGCRVVQRLFETDIKSDLVNFLPCRTRKRIHKLMELSYTFHVALFH